MTVHTDTDLYDATVAERTRMASLLEGLTPEQWGADSLCAGWRIREVVAHLNMTGATPLVGATFVDMTDLYSPRIRAIASASGTPASGRSSMRMNCALKSAGSCLTSASGSSPRLSVKRTASFSVQTM